MRVNTNINAIGAQRNLLATNQSLSKSVERLSSGFRINRAADDSAGLSISEKLRAQVRGLAQAQRNAQDGISMIQTAEGALTEVHSMLQRMRELAVQASNDSLSSDDRGAINTELQQLKAEINQVSSTTQFNGKSLLAGSLVTSLGGLTAADLVVNDSVTNGGETAVATKIEVGSAKAGETFTITGSTVNDTVTLTRGSDNVAQTLSVNAMAANGEQVFDFSALGVKVTMVSTAGMTADNLITGMTDVANDTILTSVGSGSANFQTGANASDFISVSFTKVDVSASGLASLNTELSDFNTTQSVGNAQALITAVDASIVSVNSTRGTLGAVQNRLEHTITNLGVSHENLLASESRIRDTDMAAEMVNYTKSQILQQAGTAILAQANQLPQSVLSLLR